MRAMRHYSSILFAVLTTFVVLVSTFTPAGAIVSDERGSGAADIAALRAELADALAPFTLSKTPASSPAQALTQAAGDLEPAGVVVRAEAAGPLAAGANTALDVSIYNNAETDLVAPITLALGGLPAGISLDRADTNLSDRAWQCDAASAGCTLVETADGASQATLDPFETIESRVWLVAADGATIPSTVQVTATASAGASTPPPDLSNATAVATFGRLADGETGTIAFSVDNAGMVAGQNSETVLEVANLGPAAVGGAGATLVATGLVPAGSTEWSFVGSGWNCVAAAGLPTCSWTGASQPAGSAIDLLTVTFRAPAQPTADGLPLRYETALVHTSAAGQVTTQVAARTEAVLEDLPPSAEVFAKMVGLAAVEPGGTVDVEVGVFGTGFTNPSRTVEITSILPTGWALVDPADPGPWSCAADGAALSCERSAEFEGASTSSTTLQFRVGDAAAIGSQELTFAGSVSGADTDAPTEDSVVVEVAEGAVPVSTVRFYHYSETGSPEQVLDGAPLALTHDQRGYLGVELINSGSADMPDRSRLTFAIELPRGVVLVSERNAEGERWTCRNAVRQQATIATCTLWMRTGLTSGSASTRAKLRLTPTSRVETGFDRWSLSVTATAGSDTIENFASSAEVSVDIAEYVPALPALGVSTEVKQTPRVDGRDGLLDVTVTNIGDATMTGGWRIFVPLSEALSADQQANLPAGCQELTGTLRCADTGALAVGASATITDLPIPAPSTVVDDLELLLKAESNRAETVEVPVLVSILPALSASATASPDRVSLPADSTTPVPSVLLDGRASVAIDATSTWTQDTSDGAPAVTFDGFASGEAAAGVIASFAAPEVAEETTLRFRLTVDDGTTSDSATVEVIVDPPTYEVDDEVVGTPTGDSATEVEFDSMVASEQPASTSGSNQSAAGSASGGTASAGFARSALPSSWRLSPAAIAQAAIGSWSWTTDPDFSLSDINPDILFYNSRVRKLDDGVYVWSGPDPEPTGITVTTEWQSCSLLDPFECTIVGSGDVFIPSEALRDVEVNALVTITGTDAGGDPHSDTGVFPLGTPRIFFGTPTNIVPPSISGTPAVGQTLTGDYGEWSAEGRKESVWLRCTGPALADCTPIPGAEALELDYVVQPEDDGLGLRFQVQAFGFEGAGGPPVASSLIEIGGAAVECGDSCWVWSVTPTIDRDGSGGPVPSTLKTATLVDDGVYSWDDPTPAPTNPTAQVTWFRCSVADPSACTQVGTGRTHEPTIAGVLLEARLTISGQAADTTTRSTTLVVPFGEVADGAAPPVATTLPSINGNPWVDNNLTADPGLWDNGATTGFTYNWLRCQAADPEACVPVGVTTRTYRVQVEDQTELASVMRVDVTAPGLGDPGLARSAPTERLTGFQKRLITSPTIDSGVGGPQVGLEATITAPAVWSEMPLSTGDPVLGWEFCDDGIATSCSGTVFGGATIVPAANRVGSFLRGVSNINFVNPLGNTGLATAQSDIVGPILAAELVVTTDLDGGMATLTNGESLTVQGAATGGTPPITYEWTQTSGEDAIVRTGPFGRLEIAAPITGSGILEFTLTATDSGGTSGTVDITVEYGGIDGLSPELCEAVAAIRGFDDLVYGDITIANQGGTSTTPGLCNLDTEITLNSARVTYGDLVTGGANVFINNDGVSITDREDAQFGFRNGGLAIDFRLPSLEIPDDAALTIDFGPEDGTYELVGAFVGPIPPVIDVNFRWAGASRLAFGEDAAGVQTVSFGAIGWQGLESDGTPVPGRLPEPPADSPLIELSGEMASDSTFSLELSTVDLLRFEVTSVDFAGSVARVEPGEDLVFTASASLGSPVSFIDNVVLESMSLSWDGETFEGDGVVTVSPNGDALEMAAAFSFSNPDEWSATLSLAVAGTWTPVEGLDFVNPTVSGTMERRSFNDEPYRTFIDANIGADSITIGDDTDPVVEFTDPSFNLLYNFRDAELSFASEVSVSAFEAGTLDASLEGTLNTGTGEFSAEVGLGSFTLVAGIELNFATLHLQGDGDGLSIAVVANARLFGTTVNVTISYSDEGALAMVEVGEWTPFFNAPTFNDTWFVISTFETEIEIGGEPVTIVANSLTLSSSSGVPRWFGDLIGDNSATAQVYGSIAVAPLTFEVFLEFNFDSVRVFEVEGVELALDTVTFEVSASDSSFRSALVGAGSLTMPAVGGGNPQTLDINVGLSNNGFQTTGTLGPLPTWQDAFGVDGMRVDNMFASVSIGGFGPSVGFSADVTLPNGWADDIGIARGTPIELAASISASFGCFGISIGQPGSDDTVIDIANLGAVTASYASLYVAPTGCEVGDLVIDPGMAMTFDGTVLGVDVLAELSVAPSVDGSVTVDARLELGNIRLKDLRIEDTFVEINIAPGVKSVSFAANTEIFGVTADVSGTFRAEPGKSIVEFSGQFAAPNLGGFELEDLSVDFSYSSTPTGTELAITANLAVNLLGNPQEVFFEFELINGRVTQARGSADVTITVSELTITGTGDFEFVRGQFPTMNIAGTASVDGRQLTSVSAVLRDGYLGFEAELARGGIFTSAPRLAGEVVWPSSSNANLPQLRNIDGDLVQAQAGDFRFEAGNIGIGIDDFTLNGNVLIGRVEGQFFADIEAELNLGLGGRSSVDIGFRGQFEGNGDLTLTGNGALTIGGIRGVALDFLISNQGGDITLSAGAELTISGLGNVAVNGTFDYTSEFGWLYELNGSLVIQTSQHNFGSGAFTAYRTTVYDPRFSDTYTATGMEADIDVDIPDLASGSATVAIASTGYFSFDANLATQGKLADAVGTVNAAVSFTSSGTYKFRLTVSDVMKIPGEFTLAGSVKPSGAFDVSVKIRLGPWTASHSFVACTAYVTAGGTIEVTVVSDPAIGQFDIDGEVDAEVAAGCGEKEFSVGVAANFSYSAPSMFSLSVKLKFRFLGVGRWEPTVYSA